MPTRTFGNSQPQTKTSEDYVAELQQLIGVKFPVGIIVQNGQIIHFTFETEWKEGGTGNRVAKFINGELDISYDESYTDRQLTAEQVAQLEQWAAQNVKQ